MKLIIDENVSPVYMEFFANKGFSVERTRDREPDESIMAWAEYENAVILTRDNDFRENRRAYIKKIKENPEKVLEGVNRIVREISFSNLRYIERLTQ